MKKLGSNSKPNSFQGKLFNRYTGPGNPVHQHSCLIGIVDLITLLEKQADLIGIQNLEILFNNKLIQKPYTGQIYRVNDPPASA